MRNKGASRTPDRRSTPLTWGRPGAGAERAWRLDAADQRRGDESCEPTGALSARGAHEYDFNVGLAKRVVASLKKGGYDNVAMIVVSGAGRTQLMQRVLRANEMRADLLLSIHHDDVQPRYYKKWSFEGRSYNYSDLYSGYSLFVSKQNESFAASFSFARDLAKEMLSRGLGFSHHHAEQIPGEGRDLLDKDLGVYRYDDLFVLKHTNAPSVLLETGVIVNRDEELRLKSGAHQDAISAAVVAAVNDFCGGSR